MAKVVLVRRIEKHFKSKHAKFNFYQEMQTKPLDMSEIHGFRRVDRMENKHNTCLYSIKTIISPYLPPNINMEIKLSDTEHTRVEATNI